MTLQDLVARARRHLEHAGISDSTAALDAEILARHVLGWDRVTYLTHRDHSPDDGFVERYRGIIERRSTREPVAYIRGVQEFWGRDFRVTPAVLIPRPETEFAVEIAGEYLAAHPRASIVDVGTGSGCIAITLALEHPSATIYATDISEDALTVARQNAARLGADGIEFAHGAYFASIPEPVHLVVTNPPYIAETDRRALAPEVREHEPGVALFGGDDGFDRIVAILHHCRRALAADGRLVMEIGYGQDERLEREMGNFSGLALREIRADLQGIPRVAVIEPAAA